MPAQFRPGIISDVLVQDLSKHLDERGWLCELFRHDELPPDMHPAMVYISHALPGVVRGPHAHRAQTDLFCFVGPGNFQLVLWDDRPDSSSYRVQQVVFAGQDNPQAVRVPPGVVHGYKSLGPGPGLVFNAPNRLYAGEGKKEPVDEIRHEADPESPFRL